MMRGALVRSTLNLPKRGKKVVAKNLDPYWDRVSLLIQANNGLVDLSPRPKQVNVTSVSLSSSVSKYGSSSFFFSGSSSILTTNSTEDLGFGTGDFTLDFWIYALDVAPIADGRPVTFGSALNLTYRSSGIGLVHEAVSHILSTSTQYSLNAWAHIAWARYGSYNFLYKDGARFGVVENNVGLSSGYLAIRSAINNAYFDCIRVTKGVARYGANFNPETDTYLAY
jgi:hypothetical protein